MLKAKGCLGRPSEDAVNSVMNGYGVAEYSDPIMIAPLEGTYAARKG
jgi:hypothetical protein